MSGLLNNVVFGIYNTVKFVRRSFGEVNAMASKTGGRTTCRSNPRWVSYAEFSVRSNESRELCLRGRSCNRAH